MTTHLRMNAIYWGLTALCIMNNKDVLDKEEVVNFVMSCWDEETGLSYSFPLSRLSHLPSLSRRFWESSGSRRPSVAHIECHSDFGHL
jgi:prenyltransferase beta subunit